MRPAIASISLENLAHNYHVLCEKSGNAEVMAVVKANAYGHGISLIAPCLYEQACRSFAVTDAKEGVQLRQLLGKDVQITLLSGVFDGEDAKLSVQYHLTPVLTEIWQAECLQKEGFESSIWLKVDTGMNRLGCMDWQALKQKCEQFNIDVMGIMSHLACADTPDHPLNQQQLQIFQTMVSGLPQGMRASLLNSAGIAAMSEACFDVVRPGLALYGIEPMENKSMGLKPVMTLKARVMQIRDVLQGESISYGASYIVDAAMKVAVVSMGYGDGLPRDLSNQGAAFHGQDKLPMIGRVCMDYCLLDCSDSGIQAGEEVMFWGERHTVSCVAQELNTIPYTLTTGIQPRVKREKA
ncbi:MAG: alanine racemase [Zetaproteobacteria bacterium]|nr:alanine racemase [Zetaproteobacteria bacterium]